MVRRVVGRRGQRHGRWFWDIPAGQDVQAGGFHKPHVPGAGPGEGSRRAVGGGPEVRMRRARRGWKAGCTRGVSVAEDHFRGVGEPSEKACAALQGHVSSPCGLWTGGPGGLREGREETRLNPEPAASRTPRARASVWCSRSGLLGQERSPASRWWHYLRWKPWRR